MLLLASQDLVQAFVQPKRNPSSLFLANKYFDNHDLFSKAASANDNNFNDESNKDIPTKLASLALGISFTVANLFMLGGAGFGDYQAAPPAYASDEQVTVTKNYDGFADYAKENQMEQSDVGCFVKKCGDQTKALFSNPRGIKGVSCLGRCKGEQSCATRCFAEFGSEDLNNWLSCTIEDNECVKVPKDVDNSAENIGYPTAIRGFDPKSLIGEWYKTDGLNPNYDLFDCQTNTFEAAGVGAADDASELNMGIFFRVARPPSIGGGFWENALTERMVIDEPNAERTLHTEGKMYGLKFEENWFILGESDGKNEIPPYKLVAYKGHTLQGNYEGAFVYAKERVLPEAAIPHIREAASKAGLDFDQFTRIDNTCPVGNALNDASAGTGTSTTDWIDLVVGEGGVIDWISPGWRGEYKK